MKLLFFIVHFATVMEVRKLYVAYNTSNAFCMLFMLPCDCSASGMFAVYNHVMSCPALVRKLVFGFYKRVKASQNCIVHAI